MNNIVARDIHGNPSSNTINNDSCAGCVDRLINDGPHRWHFDFLHSGDPVIRRTCKESVMVWMSKFDIRSACEKCMKILFIVVGIMLYRD